MSVATAKSKKRHGGLIAFVVILLILILALAAVAAVGYIYAIAKPTEAVKRAEAFIEQGSYVDAYQTLNETSYPSIFGIDKLTEKKTGIVTLKEQLIAEHPTVVLHNAKVGDVITYGHYEQDGDENNGTEPLEWIILDIDEEKGRVLVISRYCLDCQKFHQSNEGTSWQKSSIREWLNKKTGKNAFYGNAFSDMEKSFIVNKNIKTPLNPTYNTGNSSGVDDHVFLLSAQEATEYFADDAARRCEPTIQARTRGSYVPGGNTCCRWWLRTSGESSNKATFVTWDGEINLEGGKVAGTGDYPGADWGSVRPAMWIQIEYLTN